ncbi:MAG: hypothetical protein KTR33_02940 [Gammaproteobacteria bacterium]|nr:hypothetical protein [Gammaproteobacteria bacterium]
MNIQQHDRLFYSLLHLIVFSLAWLSSALNAASDITQNYPVTVLSSNLHTLNTPTDSTDNNGRKIFFTQKLHATIQLSAMGRDYTLHLRDSHLLRNTQLLNRAGEALDKPDALFLQGTVEGDPWSWVRGTWSAGVFTGWLYAFEQLLAIEHAGGTELERVSDTLIYDVNTQSGIEPGYDEERRAPDTQTREAGGANESYIKTPTGQITRTLRIGIVIDSLYNEQFTGQGLLKALSLINIINGIYQRELGVAINLETAYLLADTTTDPLRSVQGNIDDIMARFRIVRLSLPELPAELTLVHLFTGLEDPDDVLGLGWIDTACRTDGYDVSVSRPFKFDALLTAHEIAHNLGAVHDNNIACTTENRKIMSARLSHTTAAEFSNCSREFMAPLIAADCNLENLDLALDLRQPLLSAQQKFTGEQTITLVIRNTDGTRHAKGVLVDIHFSRDIKITNLDSRCRQLAGKLVCEISTLTAATEEKLGIGYTLEQERTGEVSATLRPQKYSDIAAANNTATLRLTPRTFPAVPLSMNEETFTQSATVKEGTALGSLVYLLCGLIAANLWRRIHRERCYV